MAGTDARKRSKKTYDVGDIVEYIDASKKTTGKLAKFLSGKKYVEDKKKTTKKVVDKAVKNILK